MSGIRKFRRDLLISSRFLADLDSARRGPAAYARRRGRRAVYRQTGRLGNAISKALGLR